MAVQDADGQSHVEQCGERAQLPSLGDGVSDECIRDHVTTGSSMLSLSVPVPIQTLTVHDSCGTYEHL